MYSYSLSIVKLIDRKISVCLCKKAQKEKLSSWANFMQLPAEKRGLPHRLTVAFHNGIHRGAEGSTDGHMYARRKETSQPKFFPFMGLPESLNNGALRLLASWKVGYC